MGYNLTPRPSLGIALKQRSFVHSKNIEEEGTKDMTHLSLLVAIGLWLCGANPGVYAAGMEIGQIKTLTGDVRLIRQNVERPAKLGDLLESTDTLTTGQESSVGITFIDDSRFSLGAQSRIELKQFRFDSTTHDGAFVTEVQRGTLAIVSGNIAKRSPEAMQIKTPTTILGVRGTKFLVQVDD